MVISKPCALSDLPVSRWKNGGGSTRTLAVQPPGAALDDFLWRVSLAEVTSPGEFSLFPGIDRMILLWSGNGLVLRAADWAFELLQPLQPFCFKGEDKIVCDLISGATTDLNMMIRRGFTDAAVGATHEAVTLTSPAETLIVLCASGTVQISAGGPAVANLHADEFICIEHCRSGTILTPASDGARFLFLTLSSLQPSVEPEKRSRRWWSSARSFWSTGVDSIAEEHFIP